MKKRNVATAMAAAMMIGGVAPVVAHADEPQAPVVKDAKNEKDVKEIADKQNEQGAIDASLANGESVSVKSYSEIYNTHSTLDTSDDTLNLNENQKILYGAGEITQNLKTTTAKYLIAEKIANPTEQQQKDIAAAKTAYEDALKNIEALENLTFTQNGKTVKVYKVTTTVTPKDTADTNFNETTKTVTLTNVAPDQNKFEPVVTFNFKNVELKNNVVNVVGKIPTFEVALANVKADFNVVDNKVTLDVAKKAGIAGSKGLNKLAYELSKVYNDKNTETKTSEAYDNATDSINKTVTVYEKGTKNVLGTIVLNGYNEFKKDTHKYFRNIADMKDLSSLEQPELSWAKQDVMNALYNAQLNGYEDHTLRLNNSVTRAEFAKMLVEIKGIALDKKAEEKFSDVNSSDWFQPYVATLAKEGIVKGDGNGTFRPNDTITRQEAAVMIAKATRMTDKDGKVVAVENRDVDRFNDITGQPYDTKTNFKDDANIALWSDGSVYEMAKNNVIKGYEDSTFKPENKITRAESIVMISRVKDDKVINATTVTPEPIAVAKVGK